MEVTRNKLAAPESKNPMRQALNPLWEEEEEKNREAGNQLK